MRVQSATQGKATTYVVLIAGLTQVHKMQGIVSHAMIRSSLPKDAADFGEDDDPGSAGFGVSRFEGRGSSLEVEIQIEGLKRLWAAWRTISIVAKQC